MKVASSANNAVTSKWYRGTKLKDATKEQKVTQADAVKMKMKLSDFQS